ncbi:hypothetical protein GLOTRDRAFT_76675 [Gloeophyllum trabeum ATCC 11539]|uniref:L-type lectin-like domain-containing protein n=1 Tax=Gloeophyllum trabeum (strain ATCC 11539 / FP-39264 / Madison 617) TaxID=670483 RepID=S7Q5I6_GLOTA|nr:uncharacterized protein GLOTRDRAFT_76675 [Gloeophyllum trabeum ATCC 11539]EPQ55311.1 hypothetical protein GLOTRDRAFT_76675 [Gloeophyllum trabeum ATCC 11539]
MLCRLLLYVGLLAGGALAAWEDNTKMANRTIERTVNLRTHSIYPPYIDQDLQNRWWDFGADAIVNTNKHIRLTRNRPSEMGWLWTRLPLTTSNFVIEVEFKVSGESNHLFGDGMAVWLTKDRAQPGPVFGSIDKFEGLGIFLDTYANARHSYSFPRIVAMLGDGKTEYDHDNDGESTNIGACSASYRLTNIVPRLRITYFKEEGYLDVKSQYRAWGEWTDCFSLTGVRLPQAPFLGFSALTGAVSDNHDIISVSTYSAILSPKDAPRDKLRTKLWGGSSSRTGEGGSWTWFFLKLFLFAGVCAGGWFGYQEYQRRQRYGGGGGFGMGGAGGMFGGRNGFGGVFYDSKRF